MLAQVLNPASWQSSLLVAAAASPFAASYAQQLESSRIQQQQQLQPLSMHQGPNGAALLPLSDKLRALSAALTARFAQGTLAFAQVWTSNTGRVWTGVDKAKLDAVVMRTDAHAACVTDPAFQTFAMRSAERGIVGAAIGMLGKVWSSGALAVVQNVAIIPGSVHPRDKLDGGLTERMAELAYIPIYDLQQPEAGVLACLEVAISAVATEAMVANVISEAADLLSQLQLSLNKPEDMQRTASGSTSPCSTPRVPSPQTPSARLPPLRMVPPPPQAMVGAPAGPAASAFAAVGSGASGSSGAYPPYSSMPGSPVTGSSYSSRSSTSSRAGSPSYRATGLSRTSSMARTQSIRCFDALPISEAMQQ